MIFKFVLSHEILGEKEISEPQGFLETKLILERHNDFGSVIEYFTGDFVFYGNNGEEDGGIDFIRQVESTYGVDAYLGITIDVAPDNYTFERVFTGQLDLSTINEMQDNKAQVAIIRDDFWAKFINRYETQVDIQSTEDLDGESCDVIEHINLHLTSQIIQKQTVARFLKEDVIMADPPLRNYGWQTGTSDYAQIDWPTHELDEVTEEYSLPVGGNPNIPVSKFIMDFPGQYTIKFTVDTSGSFNYPSNDADILVQFGEDAPISATKTDTDVFGRQYTRYSFDETYNFTGYAGSVKIYLNNFNNANIVFHYEGLDTIRNYFTYNNISVLALTAFTPTDANSFFLHDVAGCITDRITGTPESFYSDYLGSDETKYRVYEENGCGWPYALVQGLQLRGYNLAEKQYSLSMKKWFDGINPIHPVCLLYDTVDGQLVIRVEEREHCFDASGTSIDIPFVRDISRKYDSDLLYKTVKTGYKKWSVGETESSGIDTPQTKHTYATQLKRTGKDLTIESEFIAGDLPIEQTRRATRVKSADFTFDNDTFIIKVDPNKQVISPDASPDIDDYIPELNDATGVTGLLNSSTRYNKTLTPGRSLLRWLRFVSTSIFQYPGSVFKFTYGEGNYVMQSTVSDPCEPNPDTITENQDIVAVDPVHLPFEYEFTDVPLDWEDYKLIAGNRTKSIGISQTDENFTKFFIKKLEYDIIQGLATITAWPKTYMDILVIEGTFGLKDCDPIATDTCYRITEEGDLRTTENDDIREMEEC